MAAVSSRCTTSPTSTPLVRPLAAKSIPHRATATELVVGAGDGHSSRADFTACSTVKTARTLQGTAQRRRPPETGCLGHNQPTTLELSRTHTTIQTSTTPLSFHLTTHTHTTRRYKSYLPPPPHHNTNTQNTTPPATAKHPPPQPPPSTKTRRLRRSAVSRSHSHDHRGVQCRLRYEATEEGPLPQHQPRRRHQSSRADKVVHVPLTFDARDVDLRSAPVTP
jgi:hypothetical protein